MSSHASRSSDVDPRQRFSARASYYLKYRPGYPGEFMTLMREEMGLEPQHVVADIGSGTGLLAELFLDSGNLVWAVEPNPEMRAAAEMRLRGRAGFRSLGGSAEDTGLPDASVDLVSAGQAFHWFDTSRAKTEFRRILRPGGFCVLVWNWRMPERSALLRDLEHFLRQFSEEYRQLKDLQAIESSLCSFFDSEGFRKHRFHMAHDLDYEHLQGRVLSCSCIPLPGDPTYPAMARGLWEIFEAHQCDDRVRIDYDTLVYYGRI